MGTLSLTDPVNGNTADASVIATNNAAIKTVVNGGIDNTNIASGAAIAASKLANYPSDNTKFLNGSGAWTAPVGTTTYRKTSSKTVNTTVTATDLFNSEFTIGAGVMGTNGTSRITAWGDWKQNSGGAAGQPRFQLIFGGTTFIDTGVTATAASDGATRYPWRLEAVIMNAGAANAQTVSLRMTLGLNASSGIGNAMTTGEGYFSEDAGAGGSNLNAHANAFNSGLAIDTSLAKTLVLNVINGSASATYETKLYGALVEIV